MSYWTGPSFFFTPRESTYGPSENEIILALSSQINSICSASDEHPFPGIAENQRLLDEKNYSVRKNSIGAAAGSSPIF
jgi:hypothetical protein